jgi:hypothetical protein
VRYKIPVLILLLAGIALAVFIWQRRAAEVDALITCNDSQRYMTDIGTINSRQLSIGDVLLLQASGIQRIGRVEILPTDIQDGEIASSGEFKFTSHLDLQFSADLPENIKSKIANRIAANLHLIVKNYRRRSTQVAAILPKLNSPEFLRFLKDSVHWDIGGSGSRHKIYVVDSVVLADSLNVGFAKEKQQSAQLELAKFSIDKIKVNVVGQCLSDITITGQQVAAVFDAAPFLYYQGSNEVLFNQNDPYY